MTSQSNDNSFSNEFDSRQNDFDLTDLVPEPNAEETTAEEKIAATFDNDGDCIKSSQPANSTEGEGTPSIQVDNLPNADGSRVDKSAKRDRPVSLWRDAAFLRDLEGFLASQQSGDSMGTSVSSLHTVPDFLISYPSLTQLTQTTPRPTRTSRRPRAAWWHLLLAKAARNYRTPAEWRDTSDQLKVLYRHLALGNFGRVHSFSLNLRPDIENLARTKSSVAGWFRERIAHYLEEELDRKPQFHLVMEEAEHRRLHLHGEIECTDDEAASVRRAFRRAGGEWDEVRQHQAHTESDPDQGWASYISKDLWRIRFTRDFLPRYGNPRSGYAITFAGYTTSTRLLGQKAANLYDEHRKLVVRKDGEDK